MIPSYRTDSIQHIQKLNDVLSALINNSQKFSMDIPSTSSTPSPTVLINYHKRIQRHASLLYNVLQDRLANSDCNCSTPRIAHLQLQMRNAPPSHKSRPPSIAENYNNSFQFNFMFSMKEYATEWASIWQEFQLEYIDDDGNQSSKVLPKVVTEEFDMFHSLPSSSSSSSATTPERGCSPEPRYPANDTEPLNIPQVTYV